MTFPSSPAALDARDVRALLFWVLAAVIGLAVVMRYHGAAFPSASIDFRITRDEAAAAAADFLRRQGYVPSSYRAVTTFDYDDAAKVYLERELGLETANRLMKSDVPVWRWTTRFFIPMQQEEFDVSLNPSGRLVGFDHEIEEQRQGATLELDEARKIAERFLAGTQHLNLDAYRLVEGTMTRRDHRADHAFTWERLRFKAKDATVRIAVTIQGDRIGAYTEYLKVPEAWRRDYARLRSRNTLMQVIAEAGLFGFALLLLIAFVRELSRKQMTWRFGAKCGGALAATSLALTLNTLPLAFASYRTTQSLGGFYGQIGFLSLLEAVGWFLAISFIGAVGVTAYRRSLPDKIAPEWLLTRRALRSKEYFMACVVGYLIPLVMLGYVTAFYLVGNRFGVWSPADVDYTDLASTTFPWLFPLTIGIQASVFEEFVFRLFAISFLRRYLKSTFLAVLIPAVCWGFLHSNYPQQPFFIRGIELTLVGTLFGYVFLRYGILSTLIAHYVYDALLTGLFLFESSRLYFQISAGVVVGLLLIPLIPSLIALIRRRLTADAAMLNAATAQRMPADTASTGEAVQAEAPAGAARTDSGTPSPEAVPAPPALPRRALSIVAVSALAGLILMVAAPVERVFDFLDVRIDRPQSIARADAYLTARGIDTAGFRRVATLSMGAGMPGARLSMRYIRQKVGLSKLNEAYRTRLVPAAWTIRFFKPLQKEEYRVRVGVDGAILGYDHRIDEAAAGASLTKEQALAATRDTLRTRGIDLGPYRLVESNREKRDARIDYVFVWEDTLAKIGEGTFRYQAAVQGDEVTRAGPFFKLPEAWVRKEQERTFKDILVLVLAVCSIGGVVVLAMRLFVRRIRQRRVDWRFSLVVVGVMAGMTLLGSLNESATFYAGYSTTMSLESFTVQRLVGIVVGVIIQIGIFGMILVGLAETLYRMVYPDRPGVAAWFRETLRADTPQARVRLREALALSYAACFLAPGVRHLLDLGGRALASPVGREAGALPFATSRLPEAGMLLSATTGAVMGGALLLVIALLIRHYLRRSALRPVIIGAACVLLAVIQGGSAKSWIEFAGVSMEQIVVVAIVGLCIRYAWRDNLLAYVLTLFLVALTQYAETMISASTGVYRMAGIRAMLPAALPLLAWVWMAWRKKEAEAR